MRTLQAPQLALLQLLFVPVIPSFTASTSHSVVRASYCAAYDFPLTRKVAASCVIGVSAGRKAGPAASPACSEAAARSTPMAVSARPCPAAFRKCLREKLIGGVMLAQRDRVFPVAFE